MEPLEVRDAREYEASFLTPTEDGVQAIVAILAAQGAEIILEGTVRKIELAYRIKKMAEAYFGFFHFKAVPEKVPVIDRECGLHPQILRHLIVTPPFAKPKPRFVPMFKSQAPPPRPVREEKPAAALPLSNEALERRIEEILQ